MATLLARCHGPSGQIKVSPSPIAGEGEERCMLTLAWDSLKLVNTLSRLMVPAAIASIYSFSFLWLLIIFSPSVYFVDSYRSVS